MATFVPPSENVPPDANTIPLHSMAQVGPPPAGGPIAYAETYSYPVVHGSPVLPYQSFGYYPSPPVFISPGGPNTRSRTRASLNQQMVEVADPQGFEMPVVAQAQFVTQYAAAEPGAPYLVQTVPVDDMGMPVPQAALRSPGIRRPAPMLADTHESFETFQPDASALDSSPDEYSMEYSDAYMDDSDLQLLPEYDNDDDDTFDPSKKPLNLDQAVSLYISHLIKENQRIVRIADHNTPAKPVNWAAERYARDVLREPAKFPTKKFRAFLGRFNIEIEVNYENPDDEPEEEASSNALDANKTTSSISSITGLSTTPGPSTSPPIRTTGGTTPVGAAIQITPVSKLMPMQTKSVTQPLPPLHAIAGRPVMSSRPHHLMATSTQRSMVIPESAETSVPHRVEHVMRYHPMVQPFGDQAILGRPSPANRAHMEPIQLHPENTLPRNPSIRQVMTASTPVMNIAHPQLITPTKQAAPTYQTPVTNQVLETTPPMPLQVPNAHAPISSMPQQPVVKTQSQPVNVPPSCLRTASQNLGAALHNPMNYSVHSAANILVQETQSQLAPDKSQHYSYAVPSMPVISAANHPDHNTDSSEDSSVDSDDNSSGDRQQRKPQDSNSTGRLRGTCSTGSGHASTKTRSEQNGSGDASAGLVSSTPGDGVIAEPIECDKEKTNGDKKNVDEKVESGINTPFGHGHGDDMAQGVETESKAKEEVALKSNEKYISNDIFNELIDDVIRISNEAMISPLTSPQQPPRKKLRR